MMSGMGGTATAISVQGLSVKLGGQAVLQDVSLNIEPGRLVGLLGPSGAGKTTLIRSIVGRQHISQGRATIFGQPAGAPGLRSQIGYMPQGSAVYPDLTVSENVAYFAKMGGYSAQAGRDAVESVGLDRQAEQLVRTLSGGQLSRVSLAIALLGEPPLLILDEPTVGVDPVLREQLWGVFHALAKRGSTLLVTSHVMDEASRCQDLLLIRGGKLLAQGTPAELQKRTGTNNVEDSFLKLVGEAA